MLYMCEKIKTGQSAKETNKQYQFSLKVMVCEQAFEILDIPDQN